MSAQYTVNTPISFPVKTTQPVVAPISGLFFVLNGDLITVEYSVSSLDVGSDLIKVSFTPSQTGVYSIFADGVSQTSFEVVANTINQVLSQLVDSVGDLKDEALGSWEWDKSTGVLSLYRQDGTDLVKFNVVDSGTVTSRELILP